MKKETLKTFFKKYSHSIAISSILVVSFVLRIYRLGYQSLWNDEILSVQIASNPILKILTVSFWRDTHQPLYYLILRIFISISKDEILLRLPSLFFGVLSIYVFYLILKHWFAKDVSLVGTLLMTFSAFHVWYSQETRPYMMMLFLSLLAFYLLRRLMENKSTWLRVGFVLSTAATYYCQSISLPFILFLGIYVIIYAEKEDWKYWMMTFVFLGILMAPTLIGLLFKPPSHSADIYREVNPGQLLYIFWAFCTGYSLGPSLRDLHFMNFSTVMQQYYWMLTPLGIIIISLAIIGFKDLWLKNKQIFLSLFIWISLPGLFVVLGALFTNHPINVRYVILVFPAFLIVIAVSLLILRFRWVTRLLIILLVVVNGFSLINYYDNPKYQRENTKEAAKFLIEHTTEKDLIIASASYTTNNLKYYYSGKARIVGYPQNGEGYVSKNHLDNDFKRLLTNQDDFWLFLSRTYHSDPNEYIKKYSDLNFRKMQIHQWGGTQLIQYEIPK